jgi:dienelactone hydrolase
MFRRKLALAALAATLLLTTSMDAKAQPGKPKSAIATTFAEKLAAGKTSECIGMLDDTMRAALPEPMLKAVWNQMVAKYGPYKQHLAPRVQTGAGATIVFVPAVFGTQTLDLKIAFAASDKVAGFFIVPHTEDAKEPRYSNPLSFKEQAIKIGEGKWQLDGTVTVPTTGNAPYPAVILVHGSGAHDKDETIGPNKPFRDLAHGLASRGILVVRYNKRTKQHAADYGTQVPKNFTVKDEILDDVLFAANALRARPDVDKQNIFVLGHSQGGTVLPRIAAADPQLKGLISLAGGNVPIEDAMISQMRYIDSIGQGGGKLNDSLKETAEKVKALKEEDADKDIVLLGAHPAYWLDLRKHDPLVEIKSVDKPMLFLQGGRDYQVTADGDFQSWKTALADRPAEQVTFKFYPNLNHLFIAGTGKATPQEYLSNAGNVDAQTVADIADWVLSVAKPAK